MRVVRGAIGGGFKCAEEEFSFLVRRVASGPNGFIVREKMPEPAFGDEPTLEVAGFEVEGDSVFPFWRSGDGILYWSGLRFPLDERGND